MDAYIDHNCIKCINCRACSAVCPERSIYITRFERDSKEITYHLHTRKESQYCQKCLKKHNGITPCEEICPEQIIRVYQE